MKRVEIEADQMPGQDSFLDVITNIVGILILLVLVVGLRTSRAVSDASEVQVADQDQTQDQLQKAYNNALSTEMNVRELVRRVGAAYNEAEFREAERGWLSTAIAQAEKEIAERRARLSTDGQRDFDLRRKLKEAQATLDELTRQQIALMSEDTTADQIECQPTSIGKAVTGKELHLLLSEDHVAIVPIDDLIEQVKVDVGQNAWRLKNQPEMVRTVGPIDGFRARYTYVKEDVMRSSDAGTYMMGSIGRLFDCVFLPETTPAGEPASEAMRPDSELFAHLRRLKPEGTTVTIWTYPGNYDRLRNLKRAIRDLGFQIAVRPLPKGMPMGASSNGSKSLSE